MNNHQEQDRLARLSAEILNAEQRIGGHAEKLRLLFFAMTVAEKLDVLEERLDPVGPPARHAALVHQRIIRLKKLAGY